MLVVNPEKRFTVDQCLDHPWMTAKAPNVNDSTDGLVGGIAGLDVHRRGVVRERTLLASINSVQVTRLAETNGKTPVEVHKKNQNTNMEPRPFDTRNPENFVALGGKGDPELFGNDATSHYTTKDVAESGPATVDKNGHGKRKEKPKTDANGGKGNKADQR